LRDNTLSIAQKDLVIRVVDAADKIRSWCDAIERWRWSGSFNATRDGDNENDNDNDNDNEGDDGGSHTDGIVGNVGSVEYDENVEFAGCLPSTLVDEYELHLDKIYTDLQKLHVDDLKEKILSIHQGNSRPSSSASTISISKLVFLDDFSFVVTKCLLRLLPDLAKLNRYMKLWSTRLAVLQIVPKYLKGLKLAQTSLKASWQKLDTEITDDELAIEQEQSRLDQLRESSQRSISDAGQSLDAMLDLLEGHDDVLPDHWIDVFETAESDIGTWSLAAEQKIFKLRTKQKASIPEVLIEPEATSLGAAAHHDVEPIPETENHDLQSTEQSSQYSKSKSIDTSETNIPHPVPKSAENHHLLPAESNNNNESNKNGTNIPLPVPETSDNYDHLSLAQSARSDNSKVIDNNNVASPLPIPNATENDHHQSPEKSTYSDISKAIAEKAEVVDNMPSSVQVNHLPISVNELESSSQVGSGKTSGLPLLSLSQLGPASDLQLNNRNSTSTVSDHQLPHSKLSSSLPSPTTPGAQDPYLTEPSSPPEPDARDFSILSDHESSTDQILSPNSSVLEIKNQESSIDLSAEDVAAEDTVIHHYLTSTGAQTPTRLASNQDPSMLSAISGTSFTYNSDDEFDNDEMDDSPSRRVAQLPKPPLNAMMKKRQDKAILPTIVTILDDPATAEPASPNSVVPTIKDSSPLLSPISPTVPLQDQISSILEAIPTPIRLKSGPAANAPDVKRHRARTPSLTQGKRPITHANQPTLTLAPADETGPRRTNSKEPDIRLYHLIQTGRDKPIKLFIRRVGENGERVMVRVGGGWADLGEYLRIYAEHHGRRTASDGRVEIQPLTSPSTTSNTSTPNNVSSSRRGSLLGSSSSTTAAAYPTRPDSALSNTPQQATPLNSSPQSQPSAAVAAASLSSSAASRRVATWDEVGLAGPLAKRAEVTGERKEWIDSVVEQAKRSMGAKVEVGELGRSGATRRIFFKGRAATPTSGGAAGAMLGSGSSRAGTPTAERAATPTSGARAGSRSATPNGGE
jgi:hypothetical protein